MSQLDRIGEQDERLSARNLQGPYEDWRQQEVPFGLRSLFLVPWRAYLDTWDTRKYAEVLGVHFNVRAEEAEGTAQMLGEAGFRSARVEIGWGNFTFEDETKLSPAKETELRTILQSLRRHGLRPLILLNANSGLPVPYRYVNVVVTKPASAGEREVYVASAAGIRLHYTGFENMRYQAMYPVIVDADAGTGRLTLSAPLPQDVKQGELRLVELKYRPFSGYMLEDGSPNEAGKETVQGWMRYVSSVTSFVRSALQTDDFDDAGFDLEVWNEYTFGSEFLDINNYYDPGFTFAEPITYTGDNGEVASGTEAILPMTVDYVKRAENGLPGVRVISGFANQRPWDNGTEMWEGQAGFSRHYYTSYDPDKLLITPFVYPNPDHITIDGQGNPDGVPSGVPDRIVPGTNVVPVHRVAMPEYWLFAYQTEYLVRDIQPFPGPWYTHHRYSNPGNGRQAEVWQTETNYYRAMLAEELSGLTGVSPQSQAMSDLMHAIGSKATLRQFVFFGHKGLQTVNLYATKETDLSFALLPEAFFQGLADEGHTLTDAVRELAGPQLQAIVNVTRVMQKGEVIEAPRKVKVEEIRELEPRLVYRGQGTDAHPDRYHADDLAVLPFQLRADSFAIAYYVVTRNLLHSWQPELDLLDPKRYDMPLQTFEITLSNVRGIQAEVRTLDPITGMEETVEIVEASLSSMTVRVQATDYPRLLLITEAKPGPMLESPSLLKQEGASQFSFVPNVDGMAVVTWGRYPVRTGGSFLMEEFEGEQLQGLIASSQVGTIDHYYTLSARKGSWRWSGLIVPEYSEAYTFLLDTDNAERPRLWIEDQLVIPGNGVLKGTIALEAGKPYQLTLTYSSPYATPHSAVLFWASDSQPRETVAPVAYGQHSASRYVRAGEKSTFVLDGFGPMDGVQARYASGGLEVRYPQWNYDVRQVWWPS